MGIKNLSIIINKFAPDAITKIDIEILKSWKVGIDASINIYQLYNIGKSHNIINKKGKYINHLQGTFFRVIKLITTGIYPCFIFDGKPPPSKYKILQKRKLLRDNSQNIKIPINAINEIIELLEYMGIQCLQAPSEAEAQAAVCNHINGGAVIDAVVTEDMDALAFGAKLLIRGMNASAKKIQIISLDKILTSLHFTYIQFIDLCILLGCDYTGTIKGIGPHRATKLMQKWGSIEKILINENIKDYDNCDFILARKLFISPETTKIVSNIKPITPTLDSLNNLYNFLVNKHGLEPVRIKNGIKILAQYYNLVF